MLASAVETLLLVVRSTSGARASQISTEAAIEAYTRCIELLHPQELAQLVQECCTQAEPQERAAFAVLLHQGFLQALDTEARRWARIDPLLASPAQIARMHAVAHQRYPAVLEALIRRAGTPETRQIITSIAVVAAQAVMTQ